MILRSGKVDDSPIQARFLLRYQSAGNRGFALDLDVEMPGRGITAIFGPSGSGKTTLLRCIAGLEKPDQGYLTVDGEVWQNGSGFIPPHKRPLGYVFQESSLFPHLSAQGNLDYAIKRSATTVPPDLVSRVVAMMGIEALLPRSPDQLSGGERQRIAIARALLIQPRLLLMDEPLAALDTDRKQEILPYLERLRSSFDIPILYVSHSLDEVARLADYTVVLDDGRLMADGSPGDVFSRIDLPLRLGDDAGVVVTGRVAERDPHWHLMRIDFPGGEIWVSDSNHHRGEQVRIRVLARDISLALANHDDTSILNRLRARVLGIGPDRDQAMALVRLETGSERLLARLTRRSVHHLRLAPGVDVWAQIKSAAVVR